MSKIREKLQTNLVVVMIALLIVCLSILNRNAAGHPARTGIESQFIGTWKLAGMRNEKNTDVMGPHPMGMLVFDAAGNYSSMVMRSDLPKFAVSDRTKATPEETQTVIRGFMALFGTYSVSDSSTIRLHVVGSLLPNWDGADQVRSFVLKGDELELTNLTNSSGDATVHAFWKRASPAR